MTAPAPAEQAGDIIHILCSTDENYAPYCGVMLTSVLHNLSGRQAAVHIFVDNVSSPSLARFARLGELFNCRVETIGIPDELMRTLPGTIDQWVPASYLRLLAPDLLPPEVDKVIYLDCDIIADTSLAPLWDMDLRGNACGVVPDAPQPIMHRVKGPEIGLTGRYFNSGVMVIDLRRFRELEIRRRGIEMLHHAAGKYDCPDQDVLNILLDGDHLDLPLIWNLQSAHYVSYCRLPEPQEVPLIRALLAGRSHGVIHYTSSHKPWSRDIRHYHPLSKLWRRYRRMSLWPDAPVTPERRSLRSWVACTRYALAYRLGLPSVFSRTWRRPAAYTWRDPSLRHN